MSTVIPLTASYTSYSDGTNLEQWLWRPSATPGRVRVRLGALSSRLDFKSNPAHFLWVCNLYRLRTAKTEISQMFGAEVPTGANFGEEVFKGYPGLMITGSRAQTMNWGFPRVLRGKQGQKLAPTAVNNARSDNLASPFWQSSFEARRCLIPVSQWAEPQGEDGRMTRTWYALPGNRTFVVGGIWRPTDTWGNCYSMVMVPASPQMQEVHDRMPVILRSEDWDRWLNGSPKQALDLCRTWEDRLEVEQTANRWVDGQPLMEDEPPKLQDLPLFKDL